MSIRITNNNQSYLREKTIIGAKLYKDHLIGKKFLIVCEDGAYYEVVFQKKDFIHLTGIKSDLNPSRFFENSVANTLSDNNILQDQKYNYSTLKSKADRIKKIHSIIYEDTTDSLFMINLHTNTSTFPVAIRNTKTNMCVGFRDNDNHARTLRKATNSIDTDVDKKIVAILSKASNASKYETIIYTDTKIDILGLSTDIKDVVLAEVLERLGTSS